MRTLILRVSIIPAFLVAALSSSAVAAPRTWTGATSTSWITPSNWVGNVAPSAGDDLIFPAIAANLANTNNFPAGTNFHSITIMANYDLGGQDIVIGAGGVQLTAGVTAILSLSPTLGAAQTWSVTSSAGKLSLSGVNLNGQTLTVNTAPNTTVQAVGVISGNGGLTKIGPGQLILMAANTYAGQTTVNEGTLVVVNANALGAADGTAANGTIVNASGSTAGTLQINGQAIGNEMITLTGNGEDGDGALACAVAACSIDGPVTLAGPGVLVNPTFPLRLNGVVSGPGGFTLILGMLTLANGGNTFAGGAQLGNVGSPILELDADHALPGDQVLDLPAHGQLFLNGHAQTLAGVTGVGGVLKMGPGNTALTLDGSGTSTFNGLVTGSGLIHYTGTGHQIFTGANTFNGSTVIDHGTITLASAVWMGSSVRVNNDAHFTLTGGTNCSSFFNVYNSGHLQISEGSDAMNVSRDIGLNSGTTFDLGASAFGLSKLKVTGGVALVGATLALHLPADFAPALNTTYTIIDNDGNDPVVATFAGLAEGATVTSGNVSFRISYVGGTGNDVTLTVTSVVRDYLLSEGADSSFFTTDLLLANPNDAAAPIHITFFKEDGTTVAQDDSLPAKSHKMIRVNTVVGMDSTAFSTIVRSLAGLPLVVERTMSWDRRGYGAHTEHAVDGANTTWYFAEGSQGFFHTYLLLANPQTTANTATVQYLRESEPPLTRTYTLGPTSRLTVDAGADAELVNRSFGMIVTFAQPGAAERAMYFGDSPLFNGGHESAGVNAPSLNWFLAEGATGPFFETFVLLANPGDTDGTATLIYFPAGGTPITKTRPVPAHTRVTVDIEGEDPALGNAAVSTQVVSTQPILVERSQYWPDPAPNWYEAHNSFGVTELGTKWGLAEGRVGNVDGVANAQTYILLVNPGATAANVTITFLRDTGAPLTKTFTVGATTRFNVPVGPGTDVPELTNEHFGALITADQPIAVERALYWDANGQVWAAGTNATATSLP
jgi:autotransporter-associated beta strand protein